MKPPPIPIESAWHSYGRAAVIALPALLFLFFTATFIFPKVETIWTDTGLHHSQAAWLMHTTSYLFSSAWLIYVFVVLLLILLKFRVRSWTRWRSWTLIAAAAILNIFVLSTITMTTIAVALAVPMAIKTK